MASSQTVDYAIRQATREDLPQILEIYNDAVLTTTASYDYEPRSLEHRIGWYEDHLRSNLPIFVAEQSGTIVGWSSLSRYHDRMGYRFTCCFRSHFYRRLRVGTYLFTFTSWFTDRQIAAAFWA